MHDSFLISSAPYSPLHWTPQTPDFSVVVPSRELLHVARDGSQSCWNVSAMVWMMLWACWGGHHSSSPGQGKEEGCGVPRAELQQWTCWLRTWEMPKEGGELETYPLADILAPLLGICSHMPAEVRFSRQYQFLGISTLIIMDLFGNTGAVSPLWQHVSEAFPGRGGEICAPGAPSFKDLQTSASVARWVLWLPVLGYSRAKHPAENAWRYVKLMDLKEDPAEENLFP